MANPIHTTPTLLPATPRERLGLLGTQQSRRSLLSIGPRHTPGPVTLAIRTARGASTIDLWQATHDDEQRALRDLDHRLEGGAT